MSVLRVFLWAIVVAVGLGLGAFTYLQTTDQKIEVAIGGPFELVDHDGKPVDQSILEGRPHAIFFGFTHCPEICPTTLYDIDGWLQEASLTKKDIDVYFISVDPERDTPEVLKDYVTAVSEDFIGLTGSEAQSNAAQKAYRVYSKRVELEDGDYTMDHTASVLLFDSSGKFKSTIAFGEKPESAVEKLKNLAS